MHNQALGRVIGSRILISIGLFLLLFFQNSTGKAEKSILYVNQLAPGGGNGLSWATAFNNLQSALQIATPEDEIWVTAGVYYPGNAQTDSFVLVDGVEVYGGFIGNETDRSERNWETNITILSGDIDKNDPTGYENYPYASSSTIGANSYHVVLAESITSSTVLDGFRITGGNAISPLKGGGISLSNSSPLLVNIVLIGNSGHEGGGISANSSSPIILDTQFIRNKATRAGGIGGGGGILNEDGSNPTFKNVTFLENSAVSDAGGMFNFNNSSPNLENVYFLGNFADEGGGLFNYNNSNPQVVNGLFVGNTASNGGGMINSASSSSVLTNVTFVANEAGLAGGLYNHTSGNSVITNSIFWGNTAVTSGPQIYNVASSPQLENILIEGGCPAGAICNTLPLNIYPQFISDPNSGDGDWKTYADNDYGDLRLTSSSPAIEEGNNLFVSTQIDLDLLKRISGLNVDLGPYEFQWIELFLPTMLSSGSPTSN